jgi:DnaK suppressor protein
MAPVKSKALTKKQLDQLKTKLEEERASLLFSGKVSSEDLGLNSTDDVNDEADAAIADYEGSHLLRFRNREVMYAKKIEKSIKKLIAGEYGDCVECGETIRFERLMARPTADLCIQCKEEAEREESSNFFGRMSKSLNKVVDLSTGASR